MSRFKAGAAAGGIALSRLSGLLRSVLVTNVLGIGLIGDAFAAAQRIPNILQNLLGEGALSAAFVPEYSRLVDEDKEKAGEVAGSFLSFLICLVACITGVAFLAAKPITRVIAWGFSGERFDLTVQLVRIILVGTSVLVMSAWCLSLLNSHRRFFLSYAAPVAWNVVQILVLVVLAISELSGKSSAIALAWALIIGSVLQVAIQIPAIVKENPNIRLSLRWKSKPTSLILKRFWPAIIGKGALQISSFIDLAFASILSLGAASTLAAAQTIYLLPVALIATSIAATELPELSRLEQPFAIQQRVSKRLTQMLWILAPVMAIYIGAGTHIADVLFNLGGFRERISSEDLKVIGLTLGAYSLGLPALMGSRLLQNVYFSSGDTQTPSRISVIRLLVSATFGLVLMFQFEQLLVIGHSIVGFGDWNLAWGGSAKEIRNSSVFPARLGTVGLALGSALGAWTEFFLLRQGSLDRWNANRLTSSRLYKDITAGLVSLSVVLLVQQLRIDHILVKISLITGVAISAHLAMSVLLGTEKPSQLLTSFRAEMTNTTKE